MRISFIDQSFFPAIVPIIFYYPADDPPEKLSQILHGEFEAKVLNRFVPEEVEESATSPLVAIKINIFNCGGLAIGLWFSHRIVDSRDISWGELPAITKSEVVTKRFVFDAKTISKLKAEAMSDSCGLKPSTVEIMAALIWRAQINAIRAKYGHLRTSPMSMPMNFRGRTFDKIPENCCGKLFTWINARFPANDNKMGLDDFVMKAYMELIEELRKGDGDLQMFASWRDFAEPAEGEDGSSPRWFFSKVMKAYMELIEELRKGDGDLQMFASWRDFPFYEVDFGWGKPAWVSVTQRPYNGIILVNAKDGDGIEIWVTMDVEGMAHFQQDSNITHFSSQFDFGNNRFLFTMQLCASRYRAALEEAVITGLRTSVSCSAEATTSDVHMLIRGSLRLLLLIVNRIDQLCIMS
ncbi:hypothetical protein JRO89_XS02G0243000 [Xanthoceras sorbifolium]|uniref:Uncharacterized protein n=1 Tax=Xanthoceras sorbifolium TaxID=99658 RepID=A0ABQ8IH37_9ROSI|nr:hypothetical protein JRO89_XS02G0243000 [Xanthoceras sorbifolium]